MNYIDLIVETAKEFEKLSSGDPSAKVRNRGNCVFLAESSSVKDNKDHYPINNEAQARNALARASQHTVVPDWYSGSLASLVNAVARKVHSKYPSIKLTEKAKKPGRG